MTATATADFTEYSQLLRSEVDAALVAYTSYDSDCPVRLAAAIRHSLLAPGKRLRPLLALMACEACGYDRQAAMSAACAVEMIHTYSLIHDDLPAMDDDDLRRGRPTCHIAFGEATAILAGDALLAQAFEVVARDVKPAEIAARCVAELARAAGPSALVGGQEDDLQNEHKAGDLLQLEAIHRRKTGAMINISLRLGGLIAGADEKQLAALDDYGQQLGLAFQIVDDLLDLDGDEAAVGKRLNKDSHHGKLTFPAVLGVEKSRQRAASLIDAACTATQAFGNRGERLEALARYVGARRH